MADRGDPLEHLEAQFPSEEGEGDARGGAYAVIGLQATVSHNVRLLRKDQGMTQQRLAADAFLALETVRGLERGTNDIRISTLEKIAMALRTDVGRLVREGGPFDTPEGEATRVFLQSHPPLSVISGQGRGERSTVIPLLAPVRPT